MRTAILAIALAACGADDAPTTPAAEAPAAPAAEAPAAAPAATNAQAGATGWQDYGAAFTVTEDKTVTCGDLLSDPDAHVDQTVRVSGRVADVCQKMACWMVITPENTDDPTRTIRVLMKDHAFTVDMEGAGGVAQIEGVLTAVEPDPETVAHFESEAAEGAVIPEKHGMKYELVASSVRMKRAGKSL